MRSYRPSLRVGLPDYILCPQRTDVEKFSLVNKHWHVHVLASIRRTLIMSSSLLLLQRLACLVRLIKIRNSSSLTHHQHGYPCPFLPTLLYRPLFPAGLQQCIPYRHRAAYVRSSCLCSSMWRGPQEYVTYEFVPTSPATSHMSGLSDLDSFRDG